MNRNGKDIQTNRGTVEEGSLPGFLGNEGKSKEVSSVFAAILEGGLHQGNESQGTVQNHWLATIVTHEPWECGDRLNDAFT